MKNNKIKKNILFVFLTIIIISLTCIFNYKMDPYNLFSEKEYFSLQDYPRDLIYTAIKKYKGPKLNTVLIGGSDSITMFNNHCYKDYFNLLCTGVINYDQYKDILDYYIKINPNTKNVIIIAGYSNLINNLYIPLQNLEKNTKLREFQTLYFSIKTTKDSFKILIQNIINLLNYKKESNDNIFIYDESNKMININDFMKNKFKLERCGEAKTLLSLSNKPKDSLEFNCMLASETYKSFADDGHYYRLTSEEIEKASKDNFSQYDFYEIYAYKSAVIYILKTFGDNDILNIQDEIPILFIMELIMIQSASVLRTNNEIIEQLSKGGTVSLRFIENLYKEFGKTIRFWNKDVFKYVTVQNISSKINEAFDTKNITEEYYKNQDFLEHIVNLRDIQDSNKESKILNIIVLILTIVQVIPIIIEFVNWFFSLNIKNFGFIYWVDLSILLLILVILLLKKRIEKKKNFYREGS